MTAAADVIVVGGGVIGLSCAWRLAQGGARVTLLEQGTCGCGATGAALGALVPAAATKRGPVQRLQRQSLAMFPAFARELGEASGIDVGYVRCGRLEVLHTDQRRRMAMTEVRTAVAEWTGSPDGPAPTEEPLDGPIQEILEPAGASAVEPAVAIDPLGAILCRASARVAVDRLLAALTEACRLAGVAIQENRRVSRVEAAGGVVQGVSVGPERWTAGAVLVAAGAWSSQLHPVLAAQASIRPAKGQALMLQMAGGEPGPVRLIIKRHKSYVIPSEEDVLVVGSTTEPEAGYDGRSTAGGVAALTAGALALVPALKEASVVRTWAGLRPEGLDGRPFIGQVEDVRGLFIAAGHYKIGLGLSPVTASIIRNVIIEGGSEVEAADLRPGRPIRSA